MPRVYTYKTRARTKHADKEVDSAISQCPY